MSLLKNKYTRALFLGGAVCGLVWAGLLFFNRPPHISWSENTGQMYRFYCSIHYKLPRKKTVLPGRIFLTNIDIRGTLHFKVVKIVEKNITAAMQFSPVRVSYRGKRNSDIENLFQHLFFLTFNPDGRITGYEFPHTISLADEKIITSVIDKLQIIVPDTVFSSWTVNEKDEYGAFKACYSFDKKIMKKRSEYKERNNLFAGGEKFFLPIVKRFSAGAAIEPKTTWLTSLESRELIVLYDIKSHPLLRVSSKIRMELVPFMPDSALSIWNEKIDHDQTVARWKNEKKVTETAALKSVLKKIHGTSPENFKKFADEVLKKYRFFDSACINTFLDYLKLYPRAAKKFPEYMRRNNINKDGITMMINALQFSRNHYSRKALVKIMEDDYFPPENRIQSTIALGYLRERDDEIIESLWENYAKRDAVAVNRKISNTSLLSLGHIASSLSRSKKAKNNEAANEIKSRLNNEFATVENTDHYCTLVRAAANTGDTEYIKTITDAAGSDRAVVRAASIQSLSLYRGEDIESTLAEKLGTEKNPNVKASIIRALYIRPVDDDTVRSVCREIRGEKNDIVKQEMYRFLLVNRKRAIVRDTLREMSKTERSMKHQRIILRALAPER